MSTKTSITVADNNPVTKYTVEGTNKFTTGVDNIDDKFKISTGSSLDSPAFEIDNNGNIIINNDLTVNGTRHISNSSSLLAEDPTINLGLIDSNPISAITESANNAGYYILNTKNDISSGITIGTDNLVVSDVVFTSSGGSTGDKNSYINKIHSAADCDSSFALGNFTSASSSFSSSDSNFTNSYSSISGKKIKLSASALPNIRTTLSSSASSSDTTLTLSNINGFQAAANGNSSTNTSSIYIYESTSTTDTIFSKSGTTDKIVEKSGTTDTFHGATTTTDTIHGASATTNNIVEKSGTTDTAHAVDTSVSNTIIELTSTTDTMHAVNSSITNTIVEKTSTTNNIVEKSGTSDTFYPVDSSVTNTIVEKTSTTNNIVEKSGTSDTFYPVDSSVTNTIVEKTNTVNNVMADSGTSTTLTAEVTDSSSSSITISVNSASGLSTNDYLLIDEEVSQISNIVGTDITISRGSFSTSLGTHSNGATVRKVIDLTTSSTTIHLTSNTNASSFYNGSSKYAMIGSEVVQITARSSNQLTINRGNFTTTASTHSLNSQITLLEDNITAGGTSLTLLSSGNASSFNNSKIVIDNEVMTIANGGVSGTTITVSRGQSSTSATTHTIGHYITKVTTDGGSHSYFILVGGNFSSFTAGKYIYIGTEVIKVDSVSSVNGQNMITLINSGGTRTPQYSTSSTSVSEATTGYLLRDDITNNGTTLTLLNSTNLTSFYNGSSKYAMISSEVVQITARTNNDITIVRARLSTSASTYSNNDGITLLEDNITTGSTSLTLLSSGNASSFNNSKIVIDNEVMTIADGGVSGTTITVSRGQSSTSAATHTIGHTITKVTTDGGSHSYFILVGGNFSSFTAGKYIYIGTEVIKVDSVSSINGQNMITLINSGGTRTPQYSTSSTSVSEATTGYLLRDDITNNGTTLTLLNSTNLTSFYNGSSKYAMISSEVVQITARTNNDITIVRARLSTSASTYSNNDGITLLEDNITTGSTSLTLLSSGNASSFDNTNIVIDNEVMTIANGGVSGTTITVSRGQSSTSAATHTIGHTITKLATDGDGTHQNFVLVGGNFSSYTSNKYIYVGSEVTRVSSVSSTNGQNMITITRGQLSTTAAAISNGTSNTLVKDEISNNGTTLKLLSSGNASSFDNINIVIDNEIMTIANGGVSGTTITVSRGQSSTSAATHTIAKTITKIKTDGDETYQKFALVGGNFSSYSSGKYIYVGSEIVTVSSVTSSSGQNYITINRGQLSTTASTISNGTIMYLLNDNISSGGTSLTVLSSGNASSFNGNSLIVDNEIMSVSGVSGVTLTVSRGQSSSSSASHNINSKITLLSTFTNSNQYIALMGDDYDNMKTVGSKILIENEIVEITANSSDSQVLTISRGANSTSASSHSQGLTGTLLESSISSSNTKLALVGGNYSSFNNGSYILIDTEIIYISSKSSDSNVLTVTRGQKTTNSATHSNGTTGYSLVSPISSSGTTLDILSGNITSTGDILIDDEVLTVTNVSGTTLTVTRGTGNSSAATHTLGSTVTSLNSLSSSSTSLDLNNGSSASSFSAGLKILIGNEILNIVSRSSTTLTVTRGQYGTIAQAITSGTTITLLTAESATISSNDISNNQITISSGLSNSYSTNAILLRKLTTSDHFYLSSVSSNSALSFTYNLDGLNTSGDYISFDPNYSGTLSIVGINFLTINIGENSCSATVTSAFIGKSTTNTSKGTYGINFNYYSSTNTDKSKAIRLDADSGGTGGSLLFSDTISNSLVDYFKFDFNNKSSLQYYDSSNYLTTSVNSAGSSTLATTGTTGDLTLDIAGDIYLNADNGNVYMKDGSTSFLQFTNDGSGGVIMSNTTGDFTFSSSTTEKPVIEILNTNADGNSSEIKFNKTSASEANGDVLGEMTFYGYDSGNNSTKYVSLESKSKTITNGSEDGSLLLNAFSGGSNKQFIDLNETTADTITVGTTSENITLDVKGAIFSASDKRLKENIIPIENPISFLNQLNGVSFNFINYNKSKQYGLIAQEVEKVLPELVTNDKNGYKSVNYQNTIPFLIEGIKDLQKEINIIKKKI